MNTPLSILILEDNPADAELIQRELRKAGFVFTARLARDKPAFLEALDQYTYDLLLADYALPDFDGLTALALSRRRMANIPVILVSGAMGEEAAIDALKAGATDYVIKHRLSRLGPVIQRALEETRQLRAKKQAEEALKLAKERLEETVRQRTAALAQTVDTLQEEVRRREQVENALHLANERLSRRATQLRALAGELIMAEQRERKRLSAILHDSLQQYLAVAKLRLEHLTGRLDADDLKQEVTEIQESLGESIRVSRSLSAELSPPALCQSNLHAGLQWLARWMRDKYDFHVDLAGEKQFELPEDLKVLLFETVRELLFNAVKHARVSAAAVNLERLNGNGIRITVHDEGIGFDPSRLDPPGDPGAGLGLFSIRERLGLIGGSLEIHSAPAKGSRLSLVVPILPENGTGPAADPAVAVDDRCELEEPDEQGAAIRVLLADDHVLFRTGIARVLQLEPDIQVVGQANDGREAVDLAHRLNPNVVLMDINMPVMDGVEATRLIHKESEHICVIGLSMHDDREVVRNMLSSGAVDFKNKACAAAELITAIRACVQPQPTDNGTSISSHGP